MTHSICTTLRRRAATLLALLTLGPLAVCNTWIVDQTNGPGTNFTSIPPAIAAAAPGDVIIVRSGMYATFTLSSGLTILGEGTPKTTGSILVSGVPAGEVAVLCNITPIITYQEYRIEVHGCAGTVLLQRVSTLFDVRDSTDVRILSVSSPGLPIGTATALEIDNSRVQLTQSTLSGSNGWSGYSMGADPGSTGIFCGASSRLHLALSSARGGNGGNGDAAYGVQGGWGGSGVTVGGPNSEVILSRSAATGGNGGNGYLYSGPGYSLGVGAQVTGWSSATAYSPTAPYVAPGGVLNYPSPDEPTLELIGVPAPGGTITLRLMAAPGTAVRLNLGNTPIVAPQPGILVEGLVLKQRSFDRGLVPASGVLDTVFPFQPTAPRGKLLVFQCKVTDPVSGLTQKSNSIEAIIP